MLKSFLCRTHLRGVFAFALLVLVAAASVCPTSSMGANSSAAVALVQHAPEIAGNATVEGSIQQMSGEEVALAGGATITGDLLVPGTPEVTCNGKPNLGAVQEGAGASIPTGYRISLGGNAKLGRLVTRSKPIALPTAGTLTAPVGTRSVAVNKAGQSVGDWATLLHLTVATNTGQVAVPPGRYGNFTANGGSGFTLGVAGSNQPVVYELQQLTLSGQARIEVVGPVILRIANSLSANGNIGSASNPGWLRLEIASGGLTLHGGASLFANAIVSNALGAVTIEGNSCLTGGVACDRLVVKGGGSLKLRAIDSGAGENQPPIADAQSVTTREDQSAQITLSGTDPEGGPVSLTILSQPDHGFLSEIENAQAPVQLTYTPAPDYSGTDSFTFKANDGVRDSEPATVQVIVTPVNDLPTAFAQSLPTREEQALPITLAGADKDGDPLSFRITRSTAHGTLSGAGSSYTYTPGLNYNGPDTFEFVVNDGTADSSAATVSIEVGPENDAPVASIDPVNVQEDTSVAVLLHGSDPDGDILSFTITAQPIHGTLSGTAPTLTYTPNPDFFGEDSFSFKANDGSADSNIVIGRVIVTPVNDAPTAAAVSGTTSENQGLTLPLLGADADGDSLSFEIVTPPTHGSVQVSGSSAIYTPVEEYDGADEFTYCSRDGSGATSVPMPGMITVEMVNTPPVVEAGTDLSIVAPAAVKLCGFASDDGDPKDSVLKYHWEKVSGPGTVTFASGTSAVTTATYSLPGEYVLRLNVSDGELSASDDLAFTAIKPNQPPTVEAGADATVVLPGEIVLSGTATDDGLPTGSVLSCTWSKLSGPGAPTFSDAHSAMTTVGFAISGTYVLKLSASDGELANAARVTVVVKDANQPPTVSAGQDQTVSAGEEITLSGAVWDDGLPTPVNLRVNWEQVSGPGTASFADAASPITSVRFSEPGSYRLKLIATDSSLSAENELTITVTARQNSAPVVSAGPNRIVSPMATVVLQGNAIDDGLPGKGLQPSWTMVSGPGSVSFGSANTLVSTASFSCSGTYVLALTVSDGELSGEGQVEVTVETQVREPSINAGPDQFIRGLAFATSGAILGDGDLSTVAARWSMESGPGSVRFDNPSALKTSVWVSTSGTYVLRLSASNSSQWQGQDEVVITASENVPPTIQLDSPHPGSRFLLGQGINVSATAADLDGEVVDVEFFANGQSIGRAVQAPFGVIWTPSNTGHYRITAVATDNEGAKTETVPQGDRISAELSGLRWEIQYYGGYNSDKGSVRSAIIEGDPSVLYDVTALFRGIVEEKTYYGGKSDGTLWLQGGTPANDGWNIYKLEINNPPQVFYLNRGASETRRLDTVNTVRHLAMYGGARVTLSADTIDYQSVPNSSGIVVPGVPPYPQASAGQFVQMDVLGISGNETSDITVYSNCAKISALPVSCWSGDSDTWEDELYRNDGMPYGEVAFADGLIGHCIELDGKGSVVVPASQSLDVGAGTGFTIEGWIKPTDAGKPQPVFEFNNGSSFGVHVWINHPYPGCLFANLVDINGGSHSFQSPPNQISPDKWQHIALRYDRTLNSADLLLNGTVAATMKTTDFRPDTRFNLYFGERPGAEHFVGQIDDAALYNQAIATSDISAIFGAGAAGKCIVESANGAPFVNAGPDLTLGGTNEAALLQGVVKDDGLPANETLSVVWRKISGPGEVVFGNGTSANTTASFGAVGSYILELAASDGAIQRADRVMVDVGDCIGIPGGILSWTADDGQSDMLAPPGVVLADRATAEEGKFGTGFGFGGISSLVRPSGSSTNLDSASGVTVEFWMKPASAQWYKLLVGWSGGAHVYMDNGSGVSFAMMNGHGGTTTGLAIGQWNHCAVTVDRVSGWSRIYINGTERYARWLGAQPTGFSGDLHIGGWGDGNMNPGPWAGVIDELGVFSRVLDPAEILKLATSATRKCMSIRNQAPKVFAGEPQTVSTGTTAILSGTVIDDGLPIGSTLKLAWSQISGPVMAQLSGSSITNPTVTFSESGSYEFCLKASDGEYAATDTVRVQVGTENGNKPPRITVPGVVSLSGTTDAELAATIVDDGLPSGSVLTIAWTSKLGPGPVLFSGSTSASTHVHFGAWGDYELEVRATDGEYESRGTVVVHVVPNRAPNVFAGVDVTVAPNVPISLSGSVKDDGLPAGAPLQYSWRVRSGPAAAVFSDSTRLATLVTFSEPGTYTVELQANDSELVGNDLMCVFVTGNQKPLSDAGPDQRIVFGNSATLTPRIDDDYLPNGWLNVGWELLSGPGFLTQADYSGDNLTVAFSKVGTYTLELTVDDGEFKSKDQVAVMVEPPAGSTVSVAITAPRSNDQLESGWSVPVTATASCASGSLSKLEFYLDGQKLGEDGASPFQLPWIPSGLGAHTLTAVATDEIGVTGTSAPVSVSVVEPHPRISLASPATGSGFGSGTSIHLLASAAAQTGVGLVEFYADGAKIGDDTTAPYEFTWAGGAVGSHELTAKVTDKTGGTAVSAPVQLEIVTDPGTEPVVDITAPNDNATITAPTPWVGTVSSPILKHWFIQYRKQNEECGEWVTFGEGTEVVQDGTLGMLDPTLLLNGLYEVRLLAEDKLGRAMEMSSVVTVDGGMKVGNFSVAFQDLTIPLAGIPITVTRTYDSRDRCKGDFGPGWNLDVSTVRLTHNVALGDRWNNEVVVDYNSWSYSCIQDLAPHQVTVEFPDGKLERFTPTIRPRNASLSSYLLGTDLCRIGTWTNDEPFYLSMDPAPGTHGKLKGKNVPENLYLFDSTAGEIVWMYTPQADIFESAFSDATGWEYTAQDGRLYTFDVKGRLQQMRDRAGNTLTISRDGYDRVQSVSHQPASGGTSVTLVFHRRTDGLVDYVTDPRGNVLHYRYNSQGQLEGFFDRTKDPQVDAASASYTYKPGTNFLEDIFDGRGVKAVKNYYDDEGRLWKTVDATGKETVFSHSIDGRTETITDRNGKVTVHKYDERGNVTQTQTPDGTVTNTSYHVWSDGTKSDLKETDTVTGLFTNDQGQLVTKTVTTQYAYEDDDPSTPPANDGLLRKITDPLGNVTRFTYDEYGNVLTVTDPKEKITKNTYYPGSGKVHTTTDAAGNTTTYTYDAQGNPDLETRTLTVTTATGGTETRTVQTDYDYSTRGLLEKVTDANGHVTTYEYDANGNRTFERTTRSVAAEGGTGSSVTQVVTEHEYDEQDRLVKTWDAEHPRSSHPVPISETVYDENGKPWKTYDALRHVSETVYNDRGELWKSIAPDTTYTETLYDEDGRREWSIDERGKRTKYIYDALGRLAETWFCDTGTTPLVRMSRSDYDGAGRVWKSTDAENHTTTYVYDDSGRRTAVIDPKGKTTQSYYDDNGNLRFFTDPLGRTTEYVYDDLNRRVATVFPAAAVDVNENGVIESGELAVVTESRTEYDELGRRVKEYEQSPMSWPLAQRGYKRFVYDNLGRLTDVIVAARTSQPLNASTPQQLVTSYSYDELGNQLTQTDAELRTTTYGFDNVGRRTSRTLPLGQVERMQYDDLGNLRFRTDFNGKTTEFRYDELNRLRYRIPDASLNERTVEFTYTVTGQRETMSDATGVTTYQYDAQNRLEHKITPYGTLNYTYYAGSQLKSIASSNPEGAAMAYSYDALNRLEKVYEGDSIDPAAEITSYGYDDIGNLQTVSYANGVTNTYGYSSLNRLESLTVSRLGSIGQPIMAYGYASLASGQRTAAEESYGFTEQSEFTRSTRYTYDGYWRLKSESISTPSLSSSTPQLPSGTISYTHDNVGNRLTRTSTVAGVSNQVFTYDNNDRLNGDTWDNNGNTVTATASLPVLQSLGDGGNPGIRGTDSYDSENHLTTRTGANGESVTILYDGDGNRVGKTIVKDGVTTTTTYLVDTQNPTGYAQVLEEQSNGAVTRVYLFGHDLIAQDTRTSSGSETNWRRLWYGYDGHGTTRFLTDDAGQVVEAYEYEAFGQLLKAWTPFAPQTSILGPQTHYLYCGEQFDSGLGLYHLRARLMNPLTGRFWTMDSYEGKRVDPATFHKYLYVDGDAVNKMDPSGQKAFWQYAEEAIADVYERDHPADVVQYGKWARVGPAPRLKPDIFNITKKKWAEIKPFSFQGIVRGSFSYTTYLIAFGEVGFDPDIGWVPSRHLIYPDGKATVFWNEEGLVFYTDAFENAAEAVALIAIRQFWPLLRGLGNPIGSKVGEYAVARWGQAVAARAGEARARATQAQLSVNASFRFAL